MRKLEVHRSRFVREALAAVAVLIGLAMLSRGVSLGQPLAEPKAEKPPTVWLRVGDAPGSTRNPTEYEQYRKTAAARLKSPAILTAALRVPGIAELPVLKNEREPIAWLRDHLIVTAPLESEIVMICLPEVDRKDAVKIVNAVTQVFVDTVNDAERGSLLRQQALLESAMKEKDAQVLERRAALQKLSSQLAEVAGDLQFVRERYANTLRLATNVRERKLDNELQAAAAKARVAAQTNSNSAEAIQAKLDATIAEAKGEILQRTSDELARELEGCIKDSQTAATVPAAREAARAEIAAAERRRGEILAELDRLLLQLQQPGRITILERATE